MANRFPLIVNPTTQKIQELPVGDGLDLSSSFISNVGNVIVSGGVYSDNYFYANGTPYLNTGFTGSAGTGFTGSTGAAGFTGSAGVAGANGFTGSAGLGFKIAKTYANVAALTADVSPTGILVGEFALIDTGNVNDAENSRLYIWTGSAYNYVNDLSGAAGITGPQGATGFTGSSGTNGFTGSIGFTGSAGVAATGGNVTVSNTAPVSASSGDYWFRESTGILYKRLNLTSGNVWIDISGPVYDFGVSDAETTIIADSASAIGQIAYTTPGTYTWTAPAYVTKVCVVCVGGGGGGASNSGGGAAGGGGGGLGWKNNIPVIPGQSYTVVVGAGGTARSNTNGIAGGSSYFISLATVAGLGGGAGAYSGGNVLGGGYVGDGGGNGGGAGVWGGGGGAGGYTGNGGIGRGSSQAGENGSGGGGGGGGGGFVAEGGPGGGVGIFGQGANGVGGASGSRTAGTGGSGGTTSSGGSVAGIYGGGGGALTYGTPENGGGGAVRIIWGFGRAFPSTLTSDQS